MDVTITINSTNALEAAAIKVAAEKIARNFNKENLQEIAKLSELPEANAKLKSLFNNALFKMAIK